MGGLGPGIGGLEILVIGLLALIVVGPKDLPLLLRKVGKAVGKARAMASEFRSSFDEMARQSELDELRKEVEALRTGQGMVPLGAEAESTFREISADLNQPLATPAPALEQSEEWPDNPPLALETDVVAASKPKALTKATSKASTRSRKTPTKKAAAPVVSVKPAESKSRPIRAKKLEP